MARALRLIVPGLPLHILQAGHGRQPVFLDDADRQAYLQALREAAREHQLALHAYALMPDHVHLLLTPATEAGPSRALQSLGRHYVSAFNRRHGRSGGLWEGRFRACVIEPAWLLACQRFVESNPQRRGLLAAAEGADPADYPWSSLAHHVGRQHDPHLSDHAGYWALGNTPFERQAAWRRYLGEAPDPAQERQLLKALTAGGVLGSTAFVASLAQQTGRALVPGRRGRPRKLAASAAPQKTDTN